MNIKEAKQEIKNTLKAYLRKDEFDGYVIPQVRQRPILLIGAPGIGKTAIMEQIAKEEGYALLSYTMTHHTRQSAVGLPYIANEVYNGKEETVTKYTMSEMIADIYEKIEETGLKEGIVFLDEINCVSETLAPAMLQLLQNKQFGNRKIPEGFVLVAAGNPPEYNKSVRELDVVTLDRVRYISVQEDFDVFKEYAWSQHLAGVILTYLELKKENFYKIESVMGEKRFVTARGWQDLSDLIRSYEELGIEITEGMIFEYIRHEEIAADFFDYYELYNRYKGLYKVSEVLDGKDIEENAKRFEGLSFDERVSVLGILLDALYTDFASDMKSIEVRDEVASLLKEILQDGIPENGRNLVKEYRKKTEELFESERLTYEKLSCRKKAVQNAEAIVNKAADDMNSDFKASIRKTFAQSETERMEHANRTGRRLSYALEMIEKAWGEGQEEVMFITELSMNPFSSAYILAFGHEKYEILNKKFIQTEGEELAESLNL